ncbi:type I secretion system permease/ATPase [Ferrimonas sp.]|uniref:type I secretion system permease/ATPase n=1 Tax=Ferrimonas sp. TaxID=2080861 RepID=UPI003A8CD799
MPDQILKEPEQKWHFFAQEDTFFDPLLDALLIACKMYGVPSSADELRAGLPLEDNRLTPDLLPRAAKRGGLSARLLRRRSEQIDNLLLPAIVFLEDGKVAVLTELSAESALMVRPEAGEGEIRLSREEFEQEYLGYVFYLKKQFRYDKRAPSSLKVNRRHWFWGTLQQSWKIYRDVFLASLLISLFAIASPLFVMNVYDRVVPNNAVDTLWVLAIGISIVFLFDFLLKQLRAYFIDLAGKKSDVLLSSQIFEKVMSIKMSARPSSVGAFAKHMQEFDSVRDFITSATVTALLDLPFGLLFIFIIIALGGWVSVIPLTAMLIVIGFSIWVQRPLRESVEESSRMASVKNATLVESLSGLESIKLAGAEGQLQKRWEQAVGHIAEWNVKTRRLASSASSVASFCIQMTTVGIIIMGVYLIQEGDLSMGGLIACVMLSSRALAPMAQIASLATRYNQAKSALKLLGDIMELPVERPEEKRFLHKEQLEGHIRFNQVNFAYPEQRTLALNGVSFRIKPKERVGIIGRIGSGKSTLGRLMTAFYEPTEGEVLLDDVDIRQLSPTHVRHLIGIVPQDITLFYGTLRDNLKLGVPWIDDDAVVHAAEMAGVMEFVRQHPDGLDMPIAERGSNLSGGQRQSVALARALLLEPRILMLDEPTSSMDNTSEARFLNKMKESLKDRTLVLITHKASMLELVDRLIILDKGKIVADGPKEVVQEALRSGRLHVDR